MTDLDLIIADALAGSPETHVAILAREVVRLREALAVVVPEIPVEVFKQFTIFREGQETWGDATKNATEWFRKKARAIPADRVLGDGMVQISKADRREFALLRQHFQLFEKENADDTAGRSLTYKARKEAEALIRQHLRTNQGGDGHD